MNKIPNSASKVLDTISQNKEIYVKTPTGLKKVLDGYIKTQNGLRSFFIDDIPPLSYEATAFFNAGTSYIDAVPLFRDSQIHVKIGDSETIVYGVGVGVEPVISVPSNTTPVLIKAYGISNFYYNSQVIKTDITHIDFTDLTEAFQGCSYLTSITFPVGYKPLILSYFCNRCTSLVEIPEFDTSLVTSAEGAFAGCTALTTMPNLDLSSCVNFKYTWEFTTSLGVMPTITTSAPNSMYKAFYRSSVTNVDAVDFSNSTDMRYAFFESDLLTVNISLGSCTDATSAFERSDVTSVILSSVSSLVIARDMFYGCYTLTSVEINGTTGTLENAYEMFSQCRALTSIPLIDTSSVTDMDRFADSCYSLTSFPEISFASVITAKYAFSSSFDPLSLVVIPPLSLPNATDTRSMFFSCDAIGVDGIDAPNSLTTYGMFKQCDKITYIRNIVVPSSLTNWEFCKESAALVEVSGCDFSGSLSFKDAFYGCTSLSIFSLLPSTGLDNVTDMSRAFLFTPSFAVSWDIPLPSVTTLRATFANSGILGFTVGDLPNVLNMASTFQSADLVSCGFLDIPSCTTIDAMMDNCNSLSTFEGLNGANVLTASYAWESTISLKSFPSVSLPVCKYFYQAWGYNGGLLTFEPQSFPEALEMGGAFLGQRNLTSVNIQVPKATSFYQTFADCYSLNSLSGSILSSEDTVKHSLCWKNTFSQNFALEQLDVHLWFTNVPEQVSGVFYDMPSLSCIKGITTGSFGLHPDTFTAMYQDPLVFGSPNLTEQNLLIAGNYTYTGTCV